MDSRFVRRYAGILLIVLLMLFSSSGVFAQWDDPNAAVGGNDQDMFEGIIADYGEFAFGWIGDVAAVALNILIGPFKYMIVWNPDPSAMRPLVDGIVKLLAPVYVVAIIVSGFYFFFASNSPSGRARAKAMIQKLILSMVLVTLSMPMYRLLLDLSGAISQRILAGLEVQASNFLGFIMAGNVAALALLSASTLGLGLVMPVVIYLALVVLAAAVVGLRGFVVYLMAALFPITLFLYFFDYTKGVGEKMLNYTMGAIFTQVIMAIALAIGISCINATGDSSNWAAAYFIMLIGEGCFLMIIMAPLITLGLMPWIGGAIGGLGSLIAFIPVPGANIVGGAMTAVGGVAAGMGPGGLIAGGTVAGLGGAYYQRSQSYVPRRPTPQQPYEAPDQRIINEAQAHSNNWMAPQSTGDAMPPEIDEDTRIANEARLKYGSPSNLVERAAQREELNAQMEAAYNSMSPEEQRAFDEARMRGGWGSGGLETAENFTERAYDYEATGAYDQAAESHEKAAEEYEKYGNNSKAAESYEKAAENNKNAGSDQMSDAAGNYDDAAKNRRQGNEHEKAAKDSEAAAELWRNSNEVEKAAESLEVAAKDYETMNNRHSAASCLEEAAKHREHVGNKKRAEELREHARDILGDEVDPNA
jgi:hypothetical protein